MRRARLGGAATLAALLATSAAADAQTPLGASAVADQRAGVSFGWDLTWVLGVDYSTSLGDFSKTNVQLDAGLVLPLTQVPDLSGLKVLAGAQAANFGELFGAAASLHTWLAYARDPTGSKIGWGLDAGLRPGYYRTHGAVGVEVVGRVALATYVAHSDRVDDLFRDRYPGATEEAKDGVFALPSARFRGGVFASWVPSAWEFGTALGLEYSPQVGGILLNPSIGGMPFYTRMSGGYRW